MDADTKVDIAMGKFAGLTGTEVPTAAPQQPPAPSAATAASPSAPVVSTTTTAEATTTSGMESALRAGLDLMPCIARLAMPDYSTACALLCLRALSRAFQVTVPVTENVMPAPFVPEEGCKRRVHAM